MRSLLAAATRGGGAKRSHETARRKTRRGFFLKVPPCRFFGGIGEKRSAARIKRAMSRRRSRFGAGEVAFAGHVPTAVELYTPVGVERQEPSAGVLDRVTCPSSAKCDEKIGSDVFGVSDVSVARVGALSKLEHERRAYEVLSSVAGGFRTLKARLVVPTGAKFDVPHLLIDRHTPLGRYEPQVTDDSVWDLAALLCRMHRSGVAHGYINEGSVGVVQEASGPWFWRTKGPQHLVFGSPQHMAVSPLAESELQLGNDIEGAGFSGPVLERRVVAALREAVKNDPRGLRVRIKLGGALAGLSTSGARREAERVVAQHNAAVDRMEADIRGLLALFGSKLSSPRWEAGEAAAARARVWASLVPEAGAVSVGKTTKEAASQSATRGEIEAELDAAEGLLDGGGPAVALLQEIDAIRAAVYSPREVPDGLWPRTRNVAKAALAASASRRDGEQAHAEKAAAKRLDALIAELLASDRHVGEYRELHRIARDPSAGEKSVVDEWHARLREIRRAGGPIGGLRALHNEIRRWIHWSAKSEIREQRRSVRAHFESGVPVGFLVVHFNKTSAYSGEQQAKIRGICADAAEELDKLDPSITRPLKTGEWKPIDVFVSRQLPDVGPTCWGLAHKIGVVVADHPYKAGSIQVRAAEVMRNVPETVLHELVHALHFRNEHARSEEGAYKSAMAGLQAHLSKYERAMHGAVRWFDEYAAKDIYEFLVGVVQVLVGANAELPALTEFVAQNGEIKDHVLVILNAKKGNKGAPVA